MWQVPEGTQIKRGKKWIPVGGQYFRPSASVLLKLNGVQFFPKAILKMGKDKRKALGFKTVIRHNAHTSEFYKKTGETITASNCTVTIVEHSAKSKTMEVLAAELLGDLEDVVLTDYYDAGRRAKNCFIEVGKSTWASLCAQYQQTVLNRWVNIVRPAINSASTYASLVEIKKTWTQAMPDWPKINGRELPRVK